MTARSYVVGLPVVVTVDDDGTVTYEIDTAEATSRKGGIPEYWEDAVDDDGPACDWSEDRMLLDCAIVDAERSESAAPPVVRYSPIHTRMLQCPVTYSCGVTATNASAMAEHIATHHEGNPS